MRNRKIRTLLSSAMVAVMLLFTLLGVVLAADPTADASRTIDPKVVGRGEDVEITVVFTSLLSETKGFALKEVIPHGWGFTRGTDDADYFKPSTIEWLWLGVGAGATKTVTYTVTVPIDAEAGNYSIEGTVTGGGMENPVGGDTTITVEVLYDLTMAADPEVGGTATDLTNEPPYAEGANISIRAVAATGYEFVNWTAPAGAFDDANATETTFTMPAQNVTVTANFEEESLPSEIPTVTTKAASGIDTDSATLNMDYTVGDFSPVQLRFAYKKSTDTAWSFTAWVNKTADGTYAKLISGLSTGTKYDFKAQLKYDSSMIEGAARQFTTDTSPSIGCFIATAAYGSATAEQLDVLREFRDVVLLKSTVGSQLVDLYYRFSPPVADFIAEHELLRTMVRELLVDPIVWVVESTGDMWRS